MANGLFTLKQQLQGLIQYSWSGQKPPAVEYLVVAGGGGGGYYGGAGGGAGGLLQGITTIVSKSSLTVTVGAGGAGVSSGSSGADNSGANGCNSVFGNITAIGGGGGGGGTGSGKSGGSGGGKTTYVTTSVVAGQGISGQGNAGGTIIPGATAPSSGGGGAGTVGGPGFTGPGCSRAGANGGAGIASAISGIMTGYAGGGGGSLSCGVGSGRGGLGGFGGGANYQSGTSATVNTGGGGGADPPTGGGSGGSGIVIISYPDTYNAPSALTGTYTASTSGSGSIYYIGNTQQALVYSGLSSLSSVSGNFTIEYWMYPTSYGSYPTTITNYPAQSTYIVHQFGPSGGSSFGMSTVTGFVSFTANLNTWYHIAMVRSGSTITNYVNGSSIGSFASTEVFNFSTLGIGNYTVTSNYPFYGGITNLRVTTSAVYTSNFTPSTAPLPALSGTGLLLNAVSGAPFVNSVNSGSLSLYSSGIAPTWNQLSPFATGLGYKNRVYTWTGSGTVTF